MLTFAEFLRQNRLSHGLTMQKLADEIGVSPQFISLLEAGKRHPSTKLVRRAAAFFHEDPNFVEFLAQPIPIDQKLALYESPAAPDYLPKKMRTQVVTQDGEDSLIQTLLSVAGTPSPENDTPYHFAKGTPISEADIQFQRALIERVRGDADAFSAKTRVWAEFFAAYHSRYLGGRRAALSNFQAVEEILRTETTGAYPPKLKFLTSLHIALCYQEMEQWDNARKYYAEAHEHALSAEDVPGATTALWLKGILEEEQGDILNAIQTFAQTLTVEGIPPFGIAQCHGKLADHYLAMHEYEKVLEHAEGAIMLYRTSTLDVQQLDKSLSLLHAQVAALEAAYHMDREEDARTWLNRIRAITSRIPEPDTDAARIQIVASVLMWQLGRIYEAHRRLEEISEANFPGDDGRSIIFDAEEQLVHLALEQGRNSDAQALVAKLSQDPPMRSPVREVVRQVRVGFLKCAVQLPTGSLAGCYTSLAEIEAILYRAIEERKALANVAFVTETRARLQEWRDRLARSVA